MTFRGKAPYRGRWVFFPVSAALPPPLWPVARALHCCAPSSRRSQFRFAVASARPPGSIAGACALAGSGEGIVAWRELLPWTVSNRVGAVDEKSRETALFTRTLHGHALTNRIPAIKFLPHFSDARRSSGPQVHGDVVFAGTRGHPCHSQGCTFAAGGPPSWPGRQARGYRETRPEGRRQRW